MLRLPHPSLLAFAAFAPALALAQPAAAAAPQYAVTARIAIPDGGFDYASFDPVHRRLYVSRVGGVTAVDVDSGRVTGHLIQAGHTHESLVLDSGSRLLVTDSASNSAHLVDALTGKALAEIPTGKKADGAVFDAESGLALVMDGASGEVTLVDPAKRAAVGSIAIGGGLEFPAVDDAGRGFVNIEDQNRIGVFDIKARKLIGHYALAGCDGPTGLAYIPEAGVLISACDNKVAKVIRASDGADLATLPIGKGPDAVIYDPQRKLAFIPSAWDGLLTVLAVRGPGDVAVAGTIKTQPGARTGALDEKTGRIYLPTARYTLQPGGRPVAQPGTYQILVVSPK
jgi:hypothetical protein